MASRASLFHFDHVPLGPNKAAAAKTATEPARAKPKSRATIDPTMLVGHPWLADHVGGASTTAVASGKLLEVGEKRKRLPEPDGLGDAEMEEAFRGVSEKRVEWAELGDAAARDFTTAIRGGTWTKAFKKWRSIASGHPREQLEQGIGVAVAEYKTARPSPTQHITTPLRA